MASKDHSDGSQAELLANIKIIEDAMFPDNALKAAALQECIRSWGDKGSPRPALVKRSHKTAAESGEIDLMNNLIDGVLYGNAFYERLPTFVEIYQENLYL